MKTKLYTMRDRKSNMYGTPFASHNDKTAQRDFDAFCDAPQNRYLRDDMELYRVGEFESDTGEITCWSPEFLCCATSKDGE